MNISNNFSPANFTVGRAGKKITGIVIHTMVGTLNGSQAWMHNPKSGALAHYGIGLSGEIRRWCEEKNTAWHAGNWSANLTTVGIEHEDNGNWRDGNRTDAMYNSSIELCADICRREGIVPSRQTIRKHKEVSQGTTECCGGLDIDRIVEGVKRALAPAPAPQPAPPAPSPVAIKYVAFPDGPRRMKVRNGKGNGQGAEVWDFNATDWAGFKSVLHKNEGDEFIAVGQAEHPLGGIYYMTGFSWNNAGKQEGVPFRMAGMNMADLIAWPVELAPTPAPEPTPEPQPEPTPVPNWRDTYKESNGVYRAAETTMISDFAGEQPDVELRRGQLVRRAGTFTAPNGKGEPTIYFRTVQSAKSGYWYGVPASIMVPAPDPNGYVGPLNDVAPVTSSKTTEPINDLDDDLDDLDIVQELREFRKSLTFRESLVAAVAQIQAWFINLNPFKRKK